MKSNLRGCKNRRPTSDEEKNNDYRQYDKKQTQDGKTATQLPVPENTTRSISRHPEIKKRNEVNKPETLNTEEPRTFSRSGREIKPPQKYDC